MFGCDLAESLPPAIRARLNQPDGDGWNAFQVYAAGASGPRAMVNMGWVTGSGVDIAWANGMGQTDKGLCTGQVEAPHSSSSNHWYRYSGNPYGTLISLFQEAPRTGALTHAA